MGSQMCSFTQFVNESMFTQGLSNRILANIAKISFRVVAEARGGAVEEMLATGNLSTKKFVGLMGSVPRLLKGLNADVDKWMTTLGLTREKLNEFSCRPDRLPKAKTVFGPMTRNVLNQTGNILDKPVSLECIHELREVQTALEDLFTVEILLRVLQRSLQ